MIAQLSLELRGDIVQRRPHVVGLGVRAERLPGQEDGRLDQLQAVRGARVMLRDELEMDLRHPRLDAFQQSELVLGVFADLIRHRHAPAGERQPQRLSPPLMDPSRNLIEPMLRGSARRVCSRPADLVFAPTLACGDFRRRPEANPPTDDSHPLPNGAGLTSKPLHARRPTVVLRGSFRPRLASTTGVVPRATTDPDGSTIPSIGIVLVPPRTTTCGGPGAQGAGAERRERSSPCTSENDRHAVIRWIVWAPASASAAAHAAAVAPVVRTSSTSRSVGGGRRPRSSGANAPAIAAKRSSRVRRACEPSVLRRRTYEVDGRSTSLA